MTTKGETTPCEKQYSRKGPVATVEDGLDLIDDAEHLEGAVVDITLRGEMACPVADALKERGPRFVFTTGYDQSTIPAPYAAVKRCKKPVNLLRIAQALFG